MTRRRALQTLAALPALGAFGCGARPVSPPALPTPPTVDDGFARLAIAHLGGGSGREDLLAHPALSLLADHREMSSGERPEATTLLDEVLDGVDVEGARSVLDHWSGWSGFERAPDLAGKYLSDGAPECRLYIVVGYDIGVATAAGAALNAAHEHFVADPQELFYYAVHELHHVGFLGQRPIPDLSCLGEPDCLRAAVRYFTQMEGMAVHAAYGPRKESGHLTGDEDYLVYTDQNEAAHITGRYLEVLAKCAEGNPGAVLEPMSSGERLWYRFGALIAWSLETQKGTGALIESIGDPESFTPISLPGTDGRS